MFRKLLLPTLIVGLILAACSAAPQGTTQPAALPSETPVENPAATAIPQEQEIATEKPPVINLPVVGVAEPQSSPTSEEVGSGVETVEPVPEEEQSGGGVLVTGEIQIDSAEVSIKEGELAQVSLLVKGSLPSACHQFAYTLGQPDENGALNIQIYSLADPDQVCAQVLQPFEETIDLGAFPPGKYTILVNGNVVQEIEL